MTFPSRMNPPNTNGANLEALTLVAELPVKVYHSHDSNLDDSTADPTVRKHTAGKVRDFFSVDQMKQMMHCLYPSETPQHIECYGRLVKSSQGYIGEMAIHLRLTNGRPVLLYKNNVQNMETRGAKCESEVLVPLDDLRFSREKTSLDG